MIDKKSVDEKSIIVCDIKNCLNCGNCIEACARRHKNISRHVREGSALVGISLIPNLCKICIEPRCIEVCNREGIKKDDKGHIVITDNCVGCGLCVRACPYNAIFIFSNEEEKEQELSLKDKIISFMKPKGEKKREEKEEVDGIDLKKVEGIINNYSNSSNSIIAILQDLQSNYNYLPKKALFYISKKTSIPLSRIFNIATFYNIFSLVPRGKYLINVCIGTACHVRGASRNVEELEKILEIKRGETTKDKKFTLECVSCLGACAIAPVMVINGECFGTVTPDKINSILKKFE
ncbi:MAG: NAD(P)H-dependent oxidoreductase subunit E [bacterium]